MIEAPEPWKTAISNLCRERDSFRKCWEEAAQERDRLRVGLKDALTRAEYAERENGALTSKSVRLTAENDILNEQLEAAYPGMADRMNNAEEERDKLRVELKEARTLYQELQKGADRMTQSRDSWRGQHDNVAAELHTTKCQLADAEARAVASAAQLVNAELRQRDLDARVLIDEQNRKLRAELTAMTDARDAALQKATEYGDDAAQTQVRLNVLAGACHAFITAIVRG